jgi:thiamine monophosphate kinase
LIDDLKTKYQAAQTKLAELKAAGGEKWEVLKTGVESAWSELEAAFKKLKN